jgi:hypothetical protein
MPEYNAEWPTFTDYCKRLLDAKNKDGVFPPFGRVGGLEPSMLETLDACLRAIVYTIENGNQLPPKVWIRTKTITLPTDTNGWTLTGLYNQDYQDTGYTCGPSSAQMVFSAMGLSFNESQIASLAGTTTAGTSHDQLYSAMRKLYPSLDIAEYYLSDIGFDGIIGKLKNNCEIILHIRTGNLKTDADSNGVWSNDYGHYIFLVGVNPTSKRVRVADPTKGVKEFTYNQITNAINAVSNQKSIMVFYKP